MTAAVAQLQPRRPEGDTVSQDAGTADLAMAAFAGFWRELVRQATRMACALDPNHTVTVPAQPTPS